MVSTDTITDYASAEQWLLSITDFERLLGSPALRYNTQNFDLVRFRKQLTALGDPHLKYGVVHVAGTKGKGSTCAFLEAAFRACGYRTGLYTSPHLHRFTERIRVDGREISDGDFARLVSMMGARMAQTDPASDEENARVGFRTVFEILTAAAFQFFAEQRVDVAIVETGLGGRLDSTNMFDGPGEGPLVNIITAIGLDHTAILGNSVEAIAGEKAGILRPHGRIVVSMQPDAETEQTVRQVIERRVAEIGGSGAVMTGDALEVEPGSGGCYNYRLITKPEASECALAASLAAGMQICPSLHGFHQAQNAATALAALMEYEDAEIHQCGSSRLNAAGAKAGLEHTSWEGRFQQLRRGQVDFVIDGAHCALSAAALGRACLDAYGERPAAVIVGFLQDKAGPEILEGVFGAIPVSAAWAVPPPTPRAAQDDSVYRALQQRPESFGIHQAGSMKDAISQAAELARKTGAYVVIYGSLYLVGPALDELSLPGEAN